MTPLSCFLQSRCNSLAFRTSVLRLHLDLDLDTYGPVMGVRSFRCVSSIYRFVVKYNGECIFTPGDLAIKICYKLKFILGTTKLVKMPELLNKGAR